MNKDSISLRIFRSFLSVGIFLFFAMLYWSSEIIEEKIIEIESDLAAIKNDVLVLRHEAEKNHRDEKNEQQPPLSKQQITTLHSHMNSSLPNILVEDPFYTATLPRLLGDNFKPHGNLQQATIGKPANLHPFSNWANVSTWHEQCSVAVAEMQFGKYETFAPGMALKMEMRYDEASRITEYWVFLRDDVYWEPLSLDMFSEPIALAPHFLQRHKVTAADFKFYFDALVNPYVQEPGAVALRSYLSSLVDIVVIDELTFVARWKTEEITEADGTLAHQAKYISKQMTGGLRPLAAFVYQYFPNGKKIINNDAASDTYKTSSVWAQNFSQHWARNIIPSCGPWIFESMSDREIRFKRNTEFYNPLAVLVEGSVEFFKEGPESIWQDFRANKLNVYTLQPEQKIELANFLSSAQYKEQEHDGDAIRRIDFVARSYAYIGWNQAKPFFKSKKVRQALTLAIDRERIINQFLNGLGVAINGPFYPYSPDYDNSIQPWPYNLETARQLLQQEGWYDSNGKGIIDKMIEGASTSFEFSLTYYVKNPTTKAIAEYISTSLKELNIICNLNGVDIADLSSTFDEKSFDAILLGWSLGTPPEDLRQIWSSEGAEEKGSSNAVGFKNRKVDEIIRQLDYTFDLPERKLLYRQFNRIIYDECPYTFLYAPKTIMLYRSYLQNVWIPAERQDLVPGANVAEPVSGIFWITKHG